MLLSGWIAELVAGACSTELLAVLALATNSQRLYSKAVDLCFWYLALVDDGH